MHGLYVRRMIPEPGDPDYDVLVAKTFHKQTNEELIDKEVKQMEANDQAIQTILVGLLEDIYVAFDSCETAHDIWFTSNDGESIESYYHRFSKLMNDLKRNKHFPKKIASGLARTYDPLALVANSNNPYDYPVFHQDHPSQITYMKQQIPNNNHIPQPSFNQNYMLKLMINPEDISDPTTVMNMALVLIAKAFKLNYSTPTNNNQKITSNPRNMQIAQPVQDVGNQNANQNGNGNVVAAWAEGNDNEYNRNQVWCYNCRGMGHLARNCTVRPWIRDVAYLQTQLLIAQKEEAGIQLQAEEFDLMDVVGDIDEIEEVNANCILIVNLQQASTSGTKTDKVPVYDKDGSAKVHHFENCFDNDIFNMFTQEEDSAKTITTLKEEIANLNNQLSKEKSSVSFLQEEKKRLKSNFKTREDELLDKKIQLEQKIKELDNILVKTGQSIQTMHMLLPKPDSFYHTEQKMALGYQNPFYLKQAQQKLQSLYNGKVLLENHDPPVVYDSEETLQLA
ncbi:retrovirus-related pol polyprotein from transposon TNT 1-94 [Tanacetum coccineum]